MEGVPWCWIGWESQEQGKETVGLVGLALRKTGRCRRGDGQGKRIENLDVNITKILRLRSERKHVVSGEPDGP